MSLEKFDNKAVQEMFEVIKKRYDKYRIERGVHKRVKGHEIEVMFLTGAVQELNLIIYELHDLDRKLTFNKLSNQIQEILNDDTIDKMLVKLKNKIKETII